MENIITLTARGVRVLFISVHIAGAACITGLATPSAMAQREPARLTVRTSMATGTETKRSGVVWLDSLYPGDTLVTKMALYVPKRCVGKTRCPLMLHLHGGGGSATQVMEGYDRLYPNFADTAGVIILAPTTIIPVDGSEWGWPGAKNTEGNLDLPRVDHALEKILRDFAIDPKHVVIMGGSAGAAPGLSWGVVNGDFFSHIVLVSGFGPFDGIHEFDNVTLHGKPPIYYGLSSGEVPLLDLNTFSEWLRKQGYSFTLVPDSTPHASPSRITPALNWFWKTLH